MQLNVTDVQGGGLIRNADNICWTGYVSGRPRVGATAAAAAGAGTGARRRPRHPRRPRRTGSAVHIWRTEEEPLQAVVHIWRTKEEPLQAVAHISRTKEEPQQAVVHGMLKIVNLLKQYDQSTQSR